MEYQTESNNSVIKCQVCKKKLLDGEIKTVPLGFTKDIKCYKCR